MKHIIQRAYIYLNIRDPISCIPKLDLSVYINLATSKPQNRDKLQRLCLEGRNLMNPARDQETVLAVNS